MSSWDDEFFSCPICSTTGIVMPAGPDKSPVLLIGGYPGEEEVKDGMPFTGKSGGVLKAELRLAGIDYQSLRVVNLWKHIPNDREECQRDGAQAAILEAKGRKAILLIGSETVKYFCKASVEAYNGLPIHSDLLSAPLIMACVQPTTVFHGGMGEFRMALRKFAAKVEDLL